LPIDNAHQTLYDNTGYYITIDCRQAAEYITAYPLAAESIPAQTGPGDARGSFFGAHMRTEKDA
jgi:hypothetical protein